MYILYVNLRIAIKQASFFFFIHWIKPSLSYALKQGKKEANAIAWDILDGYAVARGLARYFVWKAGTIGFACRRTHPSIRCVRARGRGVRQSVAELPSMLLLRHGAAEAHLHTHWFILFRYRTRGPTQSLGLGAKLRYTSGLPQYRRYVVANLRALAI